MLMGNLGNIHVNLVNHVFRQGETTCGLLDSRQLAIMTIMTIFSVIIHNLHGKMGSDPILFYTILSRSVLFPLICIMLIVAGKS